MKKLICLIVVICFSCQEKQNTKPCLELEKKYDSILKLKEENEQIPFNRFYNILRKEKGISKDSILISEYQMIKGKDSLIDLYIWDRIHTINQNITQTNVYETFKGTYLLKPNHNKQYASITKVIVKKDSCYLYKYKDLLVSDKFKLINSSDKFVRGKLRLKNYKISFLDFSSKLVIIDENSCMDCEQLQFYKVK